MENDENKSKGMGQEEKAKEESVVEEKKVEEPTNTEKIAADQSKPQESAVPGSENKKLPPPAANERGFATA